MSGDDPKDTSFTTDTGGRRGRASPRLLWRAFALRALGACSGSWAPGLMQPALQPPALLQVTWRSSSWQIPALTRRASGLSTPLQRTRRPPASTAPLLTGWVPAAATAARSCSSPFAAHPAACAFAAHPAACALSTIVLTIAGGNPVPHRRQHHQPVLLGHPQGGLLGHGQRSGCRQPRERHWDGRRRCSR